jgi:hypothetical protein
MARFDDFLQADVEQAARLLCPQHVAERSFIHIHEFRLFEHHFASWREPTGSINYA